MHVHIVSGMTQSTTHVLMDGRPERSQAGDFAPTHLTSASG